MCPNCENTFIVVYQVKDTIFWKQITTHKGYSLQASRLFIKSKIQFFESKSQLKAYIIIDSYVVYQVKDTIFWKQITTLSCLLFPLDLLFIKSKIQFFESKSQLIVKLYIIIHRCLSSQRYNFLKAIHNKWWKSISYTALRNGLEPLCAKEVLFLRL